MIEIQLAYYAGLFDGEGTVCIARNAWHNTKGHGRNPQYVLSVSISNTNKEVLKPLAEEFGSGNLYNEKGCNYPVYRFAVGSTKAEIFLKAIKPYCKIKAKQIDVALEFQEHLRECAGKYRTWGGLSQDVIDFREILVKKISALKSCSSSILNNANVENSVNILPDNAEDNTEPSL